MFVVFVYVCGVCLCLWCLFMFVVFVYVCGVIGSAGLYNYVDNF